MVEALPHTPSWLLGFTPGFREASGAPSQAHFKDTEWCDVVGRYNRIREALQAEDMAIGTWIQMPNPEACELAAAAGCDFVIVDMEHGSFGWETAVQMVRAAESANASPLVRIPGGVTTELDVQKVLDIGAVGVIVPRIRSAEEARRAVRAAHYPPLGSRGACPRIRATYHGVWSWREYRAWVDSDIMIWGIVESQEALADLESIASSGLDALVLGPFDLAVEMCCDSEVEQSEVLSAMVRVASAASGSGIECAAVIHGDSADQIVESVRFWREKGCRLMVVLSDRRILSQAYASVLGRLSALKKTTQ